jgi:ribonuclease BN (tRNA processing enzyme)
MNFILSSYFNKLLQKIVTGKNMMKNKIKNTVKKLFIFSSLFIGIANAEQTLTATIIGSGSPLYDEKRASASVLISNGETNILVDMGNGTQANLNKLGLASRDISSLIFTHHHLDHNEEFVPLFIGALMGRNDFTIVGPPNTTKLAEVNLDLYQEDIEYRLDKTQRTLDDRKQAFTVTDIKGGESFKVGAIKVSTLEVPHTIHTIAYRFDYNNQSIVVTGDLTYSENLSALAKDADFMIIDSGGMVMSDGRQNQRKGGSKQGNQQTNSTRKNSGENSGQKGKVKAHLNLQDSSAIAAKSQVKNIVYTHFVPGTIDTQASLKEIRKNYSGNVIFGEDLMVLNNLIDSTASTTSPLNKTNSYVIVDTGQTISYNNDAVISLPTEDENFFGQDANYIINQPSYTDNNDGTIKDNVTGLMWQQGLTEKLTYEEALQQVKTFNLADHSDWRIPTIKELYSLIQFTGTVQGEKAITPFIDTHYFSQPIGDVNQGEREIDAQVWTSTEYVGKTMKNDDTIFGVNFVDGRIKGYPKYNPRTHEANKMYFRLVRGNSTYGKNDFIDNNDGTITDAATGLIWQTADSQQGLNWQEALQYAENLNLAGHDDWRLPNAKELQSIVDYTRSPETSGSAAIDPIFQISSLTNEGNEKDYPYFWSSTTHLDGRVAEDSAVYVSFGKALGNMHETVMDVHGAGSQRSDPKTGEAMSRGPQGDYIRVDNYVRAVRGGVVDVASTTIQEVATSFSTPLNDDVKGSVLSKDKSKPEPSRTKQQTSTKNKFINRLDKNTDGKVSKSEFKGSDKHFNQFDINNDGFISSDEAPTGPPGNK